MEIVKPGINIDFVGKRKIAYSLSILMIVLTVGLLFWRGGPNYGVDFSGGIVIQVRLDQEQRPLVIKEALQPVQLQDSIVQEFGDGSEYLIRISRTDVEVTGLDERIRDALVSRFGEGVEIRRVEMVGPQVGKDLREKALFAIFYSLLFIAIYISGRFELKWLMSIVMAASLAFVVYVASLFGVGVTWLILLALIVTLVLCVFFNLRYALGALVALIHDVTITVGVFALTDREISLATIAAFLTIVGYSLNDTIIVFDRIRENLRRYRKRDFLETINMSINQTLSRTLLTATTTLVVVLALVLLGGNVIHDFAFAMLVGIIVGTYSSVYVASPILLLWEGKFGEKIGLKKVFA